jgi:uncharacterized membrane protein
VLAREYANGEELMPEVQLIHPMLVHFPIVLFLLLAGVDLIATLRGVSVTEKTVFGNVSTSIAALSGAFALAAFYFGGVALTHAEDGGFSSPIAETHEMLGEYTAMAFAAWAAVRAAMWLLNRPMPPLIKSVIPLVEIAGAMLVTATAYYGGQLVYDLGVNVAHAAG